ncbi:MAG: Uncharacterised protein [Cryomorphaceae bacterium]|nr:MAG: Uncharacterised protein [Cryomorphaceae bacterium]
MKKVIDFYHRKGFRNAKPSTLGKITSAPQITLLYDDDHQKKAVESLFKHVVGVTTVQAKRSKELPINTMQLHTNDFDFKGFPKATVPEAVVSCSILINLRKDHRLDWYWFGNSYNYRVDLQGDCPLADITINGPYSLAEKLKTLINYLDKLQHD